MIIRPYDADDEAAVVALWRECHLVRWADPMKEIARKLRVNPEWFLVGKLDGQVVATCMVGYEGHRGWINCLAVLPAHRRAGHARALMDRAEAILRQAGCVKINLQIVSSNHAVKAFYEKLGFTVDDVMCMGKRLEKD